ncbi:MAG: sulfotransferase domain-containing protein [Rhodospirillales bacterium]|jgi:aryl sulfotransferase|nr:sulfotransferase [Rhodospirillaceae bacterium]MDP6427564.1 sulfotransferase domain-containing protein [Rhodospirillales bacterium]MDP6643165.1 sulfotransferase domain-containing protein [Rhodospirillales bacterium]MDP6841535.1 sulfotransferase domain-containing protein [Rhodospirillales bacterium]|tara:strand:+ start:145 stop:1074 length:930 start_codon:yes stop_codon:yes gene_type:complete
MDQGIKWPVKTREMRNFAMDSTYWNEFEYRDDDIIVATWAKAGTTWVQQIIAQFVFEGETDGLPIGDMSPWLDFRLPPLEAKLPEIEAQQHRRFLKTHLPLDAYVFSPKVKYVYIARDGRDCVWSMYNHNLYTNNVLYDGLAALPYFGPILKPPRTDDLREYYLDWFTKDGYPFWPFWENIRSWWPTRKLPNVHFIHYQALKDDMPGEMTKIGKFLGYDVDNLRKDTWDKMVYQCTFDYMKENATLSTPLGGAIFDGGAQVFVNKGTNKRWKDTLTATDIAVYEARAIEELGPECAHWLATGEYLNEGS